MKSNQNHFEETKFNEDKSYYTEKTIKILKDELIEIQYGILVNKKF